MKDVVDLAKWLLEKDIRAKNAVSLLFGLILVVIVNFASRDSEWFQEIRDYGTVGVSVALLLVFLIGFLCVSLVWSAVAALHQHATAQQRQDDEAERRQKTIRDNLFSLTDWQRQFLTRLIANRQIPEYEVGQYRAIWDSEVEVLVNKGIVKHHQRAGVYEIEPVYLDYLIEHWDAESGTLS